MVEADESDGSFLQYPSQIVVVTNVEADHLDNWGTPQAYFDGFVSMATRPEVRYVVTNADDPGQPNWPADWKAPAQCESLLTENLSKLRSGSLTLT